MGLPMGSHTVERCVGPLTGGLTIEHSIRRGMQHTNTNIRIRYIVYEAESKIKRGFVRDEPGEAGQR